MKQIVFGVSIFVLLIGCSEDRSIELPGHIADLENLTTYSFDVAPAGEIQLTREQSFGDTDDIIIGDIRDLAVDKHGRVFIADNQLNTIHVFNPDGSFRTSIGQEGRGPGEFQGIYAIAIHEDQLYVYDYPLRRISVFLLNSYALSSIIDLNPENWTHIEELTGRYPTHFFVIDDNTILHRFVQISQPDQMGKPTFNKHSLLNKEGEIISDMIFEQRGVEYLISTYGGGMNLLTPPFIRNSLMAVSDDGYIFSAWSEDFLIKVFDLRGNYIRAFYYPYEQSSLNRQEILDLYNDQPYLQESYRSTTFPETWPVLNTMLVDDENRLWISTIDDDEEYYTWWILNRNGELLAKFERQGNRLNRDVSNPEMIEIKNGFFYLRENVEQTGVQEVVRYRIDMIM